MDSYFPQRKHGKKKPKGLVRLEALRVAEHRRAGDEKPKRAMDPNSYGLPNSSRYGKRRLRRALSRATGGTYSGPIR